MAIPGAYSDSTLKAYMHSVLGAVATTLGWSVAGGHYDEAVNETVAAYGVDDVTTVAGRDNIRHLRALARREVWRAVMQATVSHYDLSTDGAQRSRSQIHTQAKEMFVQSEVDCTAYGDAYTVGIDAIAYGDPYLPPEDD
jgi:hypothetical protein